MRDDALAIQVERRIYLLRGEKVLLDHDLAALYGVPVKVLNQAETKALRSQIVTLDDAENRTATGKRGKHSKYLSYASPNKASRCFLACCAVLALGK
jgi:hypothetical protein